MLKNTVTVGCWNGSIGSTRATMIVLKDAGCNVEDKLSRFKYIIDGEEIVINFFAGYLINDNTERKIMKVETKEIDYNFHPKLGDKNIHLPDIHSATVEVTLPEFTTPEDFHQKVLLSNSLKNLGDPVLWHECLGETIRAYCQPDGPTLSVKVTAIGLTKFLAIAPDGKEHSYDIDSDWIY